MSAEKERKKERKKEREKEREREREREKERAKREEGRAMRSTNPPPRTDPVSEDPETHAEGHAGKKMEKTELELQVAASSTAETDQLR